MRLTGKPSQCGVRRTYWAAVAVLVLSVHHVIRSGEFPPNQLVKQVIESWDETELSQHLVDLQGDNTAVSKMHKSLCLQPERGRGQAVSQYLVSLPAHQKDTQHIENFHFIHDLMDDLHRLGQSMSERTGGH